MRVEKLNLTIIPTASSSSNTASTTSAAGESPMKRFLSESPNDPTPWLKEHLSAGSGGGYNGSGHRGNTKAEDDWSTAATQGSTK